MTRASLIALVALVACGSNETPPPAPDGGPTASACTPDLDGVLRADEVLAYAGASVDYYVSSDTPVDLEGAVAEGGARVWSMGEVDGAPRRRFEVARVNERWYADAFPHDALASALDDDGARETIYTLDEHGLWAWGIASADPAPARGRTLLVYDEPVALLRFPLRDGDAWMSVGSIVDGQLDGLPYNGTDSYAVEVAGAGRLVVPHLTFTQAHRVLTRVEVAPAVGGAVRVQRQVSFWFECFGEVARATSRADEREPLFEVAAALRRFALPEGTDG